MAGGGERLPECKRLVGELGIAGICEFPGEVGGGEAIYRKLHILAAPSLSEGFSNTVLEGMAWGRPLVASAVGGNLEAISDGETGLLVPPGDADALASALARLLDDSELMRRMGQAGRDRAVRQFSLATMGEGLYQAFMEAMAG